MTKLPALTVCAVPKLGDLTVYVSNFQFLILNILQDFKVLSRSMQKWIQPPTCSVHGLHRILSSYWLAHCYLMKKSTKGQLFFGSDCGMMKIFTLKPQPKGLLMSLPHFWGTVWWKRSRLEHMQTVNRTSRRIRGLFACSGSELWTLIKYSGSGMAQTGCGMAQTVACRLAVWQARVRISARHPRGGPLPSGSNEDIKSGTHRVLYIKNIVCMLGSCKNK